MRKRHALTTSPLCRPMRLVLLALLTLCAGQASGHNADGDTLSALEQRMSRLEAKWEHMPKIHGILRGKYEYEPELNAAQFDLRTARLSG